ncbi:MAG: GNAT family N-acetyltransferase [Patescibacteria group bacterium]
MHITIRRAKLSDLDAICTLSQSLFEHERQFTDEYDMGWSHGVAGRKFFTKMLRSRKAFVLLALAEEKVVGYILVKFLTFSWRAYNPIAELTNLSVDPMFRGQGIGTKLVEKAVAIARKRGAKRMSVEGLHDNVRALKFYKTQGFRSFSDTLLLTLT